MYAEYLRAHGFTVYEVETTDAALERIDTCQLVITGLLVPGSIAAVELIARIRRDHSAVPIIVVTACVLPNVLETARTAGCDELFTKPCFPEHLLESVRRLLGVPAERRSVQAVDSES